MSSWRCPSEWLCPRSAPHCACIVAGQSFSDDDVRDPRELEVAFVTEAHERESKPFLHCNSITAPFPTSGSLT